MKFKIGSKVKVKIGCVEFFGIVKDIEDIGRYKVNCFGSEIGCFEEDMEEENAKDL